MSQKIALITGGASGIGKASAILFAKNKVQVLLLDKNKQMGEETCHEIEEAGGKVNFYHLDLSSISEVETTFRNIESEFGKLDYAFNNAGVAMELMPFTQMDNYGWDYVINNNLKSIFLCLKQEIPLMLKNNGGSIVNTSSIAGLKGFALGGVYAASKGGVAMLTRSIAQEYADQNIRINLLCPGFIDTPMSRECTKDNPFFFLDTVRLTPINRAGKAEEVAKTVWWLCSDDASYVVGQSIVVDGGYLC